VDILKMELLAGGAETDSDQTLLPTEVEIAFVRDDLGQVQEYVAGFLPWDSFHTLASVDEVVAFLQGLLYGETLGREYGSRRVSLVDPELAYDADERADVLHDDDDEDATVCVHFEDRRGDQMAVIVTRGPEGGTIERGSEQEVMTAAVSALLGRSVRDVKWIDCAVEVGEATTAGVAGQ